MADGEKLARAGRDANQTDGNITNVNADHPPVSINSPIGDVNITNNINNHFHSPEPYTPEISTVHGFKWEDMVVTGVSSFLVGAVVGGGSVSSWRSGSCQRCASSSVQSVNHQQISGILGQEPSQYRQDASESYKARSEIIVQRFERTSAFSNFFKLSYSELSHELYREIDTSSIRDPELVSTSFEDKFSLRGNLTAKSYTASHLTPSSLKKSPFERDSSANLNNSVSVPDISGGMGIIIAGLISLILMKRPRR